GVAGSDELEPPVAAARQEGRSPATAGRDLRLVHRRVWHQRLARGQSVDGGVNLKRQSSSMSLSLPVSLSPFLGKTTRKFLDVIDRTVQHNWALKIFRTSG